MQEVSGSTPLTSTISRMARLAFGFFIIRATPSVAGFRPTGLRMTGGDFSYPFPLSRCSIKKLIKNDWPPTMKPVELVERAMRNSSRPGDLVLDPYPFAGSGKTLMAEVKSSDNISRLREEM